MRDIYIYRYTRRTRNRVSEQMREEQRVRSEKEERGDGVDLLPGYRAVNAAGRTEKTAGNSVIDRR